MFDHTLLAPNVTLMQDLLLQGAAKYSNRTAVIQIDAPLTYEQLLGRAYEYGRGLQRTALEAGDRVGLLMENGSEYVAAYFAIFLAGGTAVPIDIRQQPERIAVILNDCEVKRLIISLAQLPLLKKVIVFENPLGWVIGPSEFTLPARGTTSIGVDGLRGNFEEVRVNPATPAVINYTSGSSGEPKGVVMSHRAILANTRSIVSYLDLTEHDRMMQVLPFSYCYGASLLHTHFMVGGSMVIDNRFMYPSSVLSNMQKTGCTGFAGVPSTYHTLLTKCDLRQMAYPGNRYATQAGGRMPPELVDQVRSAITPVQFIIMYGQTEASARLTYLPSDKWIDKRGSAGTPIPGVSLRIVDDRGGDVPPGTVGEVRVAGENLMAGYWGQPEDTTQVLTDGWLHTGDLGWLDSEGFLYLEGRIKGIIKSSGYRISPREIEDVLYRHPAALEVLVLGIPDSQAGELIGAAVVLKEGAAAGEKDLVNHCKAALPPYKVPRKIRIVPEIPKSSAGKPQKEHLLKLFGEAA